MLIEFKVANYLSINEDQTLSMVANTSNELEKHVKVFDKYKLRALRTAAIFGPNASGKTNTLKAINFMKNFIISSSRNFPDTPTGVVPFKFSSKDKTFSKFEALFILNDNIMYSYGFQIDEKEIYSEWLYYYPKNYKKMLFQRTKKEGYKFGSDLKGKNKSISQMTKNNSLFLSVAAMMNEEKAKNIYDFFANITLFNQIDLLNSAIFIKQIIEYYKKHDKNKFLDYFNKADLGITDFQIKSKNLGNEFATLLDFFSKNGVEIKSKELDINNMPIDEVKFIHKYNGISGEFNINEESSGTQKLFYLLPFFVDYKGIILIDEFEASMHPHLISFLLDFYYDIYPETQLIFTSHNSDLLSTRQFRRDEIWFTEKEISGNTILFSLNDIKPKPRLNEDIKMRYLYGQYGAVPNIS